MAKIDATNPDDVKLLAVCFVTVPQEDKWKVMGKVYDLGLMKLRGINWFLKIIKKWKGQAAVFQFFKIMSEKFPKELDNYIEDTIRHIVNGKDIHDPASAGGWSQKEIDLLLDNLTFSLIKNRS